MSNTEVSTLGDLWLLRFAWPAGACDAPLVSLRRHATDLQAWRSTGGELGYAYLPAKASQDPAAQVAPGSEWKRLVCRLELSAASSGAASAYHYVVESDVLPAHEDDFNAWYDHEHLPGLAAVPGTVRAARYISAAGAPRYYACLDSLDTLGSAAWLAVRATTWSSRVRPGFCNTRRTMFSRASSAAAEPFARSD
jgi:hypothetical protein